MTKEGESMKKGLAIALCDILVVSFFGYKQYQARVHKEALENFNDMLKGYELFREKYVHSDPSIMHYLSHHGQSPRAVVVACSDSRVDPALLLQCDPGDLFVIRNVANIVPPYQHDTLPHGTSAALEFGIRFLKVKHLILLGHSECGGIKAAINCSKDKPNDFIDNWVSLIQTKTHVACSDADEYARLALHKSYANCLTFPWIKEKISNHELIIHVWFFDIKTGQIFSYSQAEKAYKPLSALPA